jgi:type II secretory pathway component GspD/PulD (secretin)
MFASESHCLHSCFAVLRHRSNPTKLGRIGVVALAAILTLVCFSLQAQSPTAATENNSGLTSSAAGNARQVYDEGVRAEKAADWEMAFQAYQQAAALSPEDRAIQLRAELARSALAQQRTEQAERQLISGNPALARAMLQSAIQLDPSYTVAQERLQQLAEANPSTTLPGENLASALPSIKAGEGKHDFDFNGGTRGAYQEVARQFGVTAAFDPDLQDRQIRFRVSDVDFDTAMRLLSEQSSTFWFAVDAKTFFVATDTANKRRDYDPEIKKTILLPAAETNDEMTEAMRMVRDIVGLRRTELDLRTHSITVRDTPANVALAEAILKDVQQTPGEFLLEVDLLEVDRNAALNLGITPGSTVNTFSVPTGVVRALQQSQSSSTILQAVQSIFGSQNPLAASGGAAAAIPPVLAFGGGNALWLAMLPGATANFSRTLSMVQHAQRVLLRVEDGRPATFFVGEHFPITLALLSASLVAPVSQLASAAASGNFTGTFPRTDFTVGHSPSGVVVGDFNGDGKLDLAVTNEGDNTVSILLGNGDGTFQTQKTFATGLGPDAIVAADFNGDGKLDLAVANLTDNTVSIFLGNGDGTFAAGTTITGMNTPVAMITGDFRNAGKTDLAVLDQADGLVSVLLGNGDGTFANKINTSVGRGPTALVTGDFNGDGHPDLAVTNGGANTVSVLLGNADGTFSKQITFGTGADPSAIAAVDFNSDGKLDLAVTNKVDNTFSVFLGNGDGTFGTGTSFTTDAGPTALLTGSFASSPFPDLIVVCESANTLDVFLGLGNASFATPLAVSTGSSPVAVAKGDFAGTGLLDVALADQGADTVSVILNSVNNQQSSNPPLASYPASEYVDLGLKVHATPRVHAPDEVSLNMQFDISALAGQNVNGIPIISNRTIEQMVRLRANETSILSGLIESSEIRSITGWPGIAQLPVIGPLTSDRNKQQMDTELVIAITPRQLRLTPREGRTFYAGRGVGTAAPPEPAAPGQIVPPGGQVPGAPPPPEGINAPPGPLAPPGAPGGPPASAPEIAPPNQAGAPNIVAPGNPQNPGANPQPNVPQGAQPGTRPNQ